MIEVISSKTANVIHVNRIPEHHRLAGYVGQMNVIKHRYLRLTVPVKSALRIQRLHILGNNVF